MLITHGMDLREKHTDGLAPLHRAVMGGHTDTVKAILNAEVPMDDPTAEGKTPMDLAEDLSMSTPVAEKSGRRTPGIKSPQLAMKEVLQKFSRTKTEL
jgi:ankyrin repeat protein